MMNRKNLIIVGLLAFFIFVLVANDFIAKSLQQSTKRNKPSESVQIKRIEEINSKQLVTRRMHLDPSREYHQNYIFVGDTQVAFFKSKGDDIFDLDGKIPNRKVKFRNRLEGTYGSEHFLNNQRHGPYKEYYDNGMIRKDLIYANNKVKFLKEYYYDGQLRMEVDYSDALLFTDNSEVGVGKIYYKDGVLMYEWNLTNLGQERYKKAYNILGELVEERHFDEQGNQVKIVNYRNQK